MKPVLIYVVCAGQEEARKIAGALLEKRLIACANIMAPHSSLYRWKDRIESGTEVAVIMKSREELFEQVRETVSGLHSYECPCIVALPVTAGHEPFLQWIEAETRQAEWW